MVGLAASFPVGAAEHQEDLEDAAPAFVGAVDPASAANLVAADRVAGPFAVTVADPSPTVASGVVEGAVSAVRTAVHV